MSTIIELVRPEIRELSPYRAAEFVDGLLRMNANETPWRPPGDESVRGLNLYPEIRPLELTARLADLYGVAADRLLVTRGSSEAIDLLIRCFCGAERNDIMICPPTFGMYEVYARIQGAGVIRVPLLREQSFALDVGGIESAWNDRCRLVFVCAPNNPTGTPVPVEQIDALCASLRGKGLVVLDGAYIEFADGDPTAGLLDRHDNIAVLRTLSKAFGLAGIRCGAALAAPAVIEMLGCILPPYAYPTPSRDAALAALDAAFRNELLGRVAALREQREWLAERLAALACVGRVWPSQANFLLVEVSNPVAVIAAAKAGGILIRDFSAARHTEKCLRITVGTAAQNAQLLEALRSAGI